MKNKTNVKENRKLLGGLPAKSLIIPVIVILVILLSLIIVSTLVVNYESDLMSTTMRHYSQYVSEANSILAGSSLLSETATSFVISPLTEDGTLKTGPLSAYSNELSNPRRGYQVIANFVNYDVSEEVLELIKTGADNADKMFENQKHALALMNEVYPFPDLPTLDNLPRYDLPQEEKDLSNEQKLALANHLLYSNEYGNWKGKVSQSINQCVALLQKESAQKSADIMQTIASMRILLWFVIITIIVVLIVSFFVIFKFLISPLGLFAKEISVDNKLSERGGLFEVRLLASAYNKLIGRRIKLESALRNQAETDALTNLPNRLSFNEYVTSSKEKNCSFAVCLFDINFLKETNDKLGHLEGDNLIKHSAKCIVESFSTLEDYKCFRFGGDEFVVLVRNSSYEQLIDAIEKFEICQKENNISIAYGFAYANDIETTSFQELFSKADKEMYVNKQKTHAAKINV